MSKNPVDVLKSSNDAIRRLVLDNGLTVLLKEDHSAPLTAIQYWVKAGSIHEEENLGGGLSHYLEHMVFKGTPTRGPGEISKAIADAGGEINAYTSNDRTVFHVVMPAAHALEGLDILTDAVFHPSFPEEEWLREREVILREVDMGLDDPSRVMNNLMWETAFQVHPYRVPIIGWRDILTTMTRDQLAACHARHYSPDNMILAIAGDFRADEMESAIRTLHAALPRTPHAPVFLPTEPVQLAERSARKTGPYEVTRLAWSFHTVAFRDADCAALDVLASIVGSGRSSLLVQRLLEERRLVTDIDAWSYTPQYPGLFSICAECDPAREEEVTAALRAEVLRWHSEPFGVDRIERARREVLAQSIRQLSTMEGQASSMAACEFYAAHPRHIEAYLDAVSRVTPDDLTRVARRWLVSTNGSWAILAPATVSDAAPTATTSAPPALQSFVLTNGLRVLVMEDPRLPMAHVSAVIGGGQLAETSADSGICQLVADMLSRGTSSHTAASFAEELEARAIDFSSFSGRNSYGLSLSGLSEDLPLLLSATAECLLDPQFPSDELDKQRALQLAALRRDQERPMTHANQRMRDLCFPNHPYRPPVKGTPDTLASLQRDDLVAFHARLLTATNTVLAVFGDVRAADLLPRLEAAFAALPRGTAPVWPALPPFPEESARVETVLPFQQTVLVRAWKGIPVDDPRDEALSVLMDALSGLSSDLFIEVRDKRGLAYYTGATHFSGPVGGLFLIYAGTTAAALPEVERQIQRQVDRLAAAGPRPDETARALEQLLADTARARQAPAALAQQCALDELLGLGGGHALDAAERLRALTPDDLHSAAAAILGAPASITSIVLPDPASEVDADEPDSDSEDLP